MFNVHLDKYKNLNEYNKRIIIIRIMSRRSIAAVVETKRIKLICDNINNFTSIGISLIEGYERLTGKKILSVEPRGGINNH